MKGRNSLYRTRGTADADIARDNHGVRALEGSDAGKAVSWPKKKRGGVVTGAKPRRRFDRAGRHPDAQEDRTLVREMVKPAALKSEEKPRYAKGGGVKKGKTTVNVIVAPQGGGAQRPMPMPSPMPPTMPPAAAGAPPMPPRPAPPAPMTPQPSPQMPMVRKSGGRISYPIKHAAGGARGRLEKAKAYGKNASKGETFSKHGVSGP